MLPWNRKDPIVLSSDRACCDPGLVVTLCLGLVVRGAGLGPGQEQQSTALGELPRGGWSRRGWSRSGWMDSHTAGE